MPSAPGTDDLSPLAWVHEEVMRSVTEAVAALLRFSQAHQLARDPQRDDQRREPEGDENVEDAAADHAADGDVGIVRQGRLQADRHLRCAAAEGDDGQADDQWPYIKSRGEAHRCAHHQFGTEDQQA